MTKEETKKAIEVMQAFVDGKAIQCRSSPKDEWTTLTATAPSWEWSYSEYRIKPGPMEIEVWVSRYNDLSLNEPRALLGLDWTKKKFREVV